MKRIAMVAMQVVIALSWFAGLMTGLFGQEMGDRVVGMLLWLGLGVGYRLHQIQTNTENRPN